MKKYSLYLKTSRCIACHGCEVHCKVNKGLPIGVLLCEVTIGPLRKVGGVPRLRTTFTHCYHCEEAFCVPSCPTDALIQREDGIIYIEEEKCIGCMSCKNACPWEIPVKNPETGKAVKCDLCYDRIDAGLRPVCVTTCATHALQLVQQEVK